MVIRLDRGQAFTLEAVMAGLIILGSVVFAIQVASVTANSPSTSSEQVETQQYGLAEGVLDSAVSEGSLRPTLLYWDPASEKFHDAADGYYISESPPTRFGQSLTRTFAHRSIRYNVDIFYLTTDGDRHKHRLVSHGTASDDSARAVKTVTLYDDDHLYSAEETPTNATLAESPSYFAPDVAPNSSVYNVIRVEVVVWRV